jgi:hypothetical protein
LRFAQIGVLWTSIENSRQGRRGVGQAERGEPAAMGKWARARVELQVVQWFGSIPDFILTFDASYASMCSDAQWCAGFTVIAHATLGYMASVGRF